MVAYIQQQPTEVFSCEFCEISKNTFFHRTPLVAASVQYRCLQDPKYVFALSNQIFKIESDAEFIAI